MKLFWRNLHFQMHYLYQVRTCASTLNHKGLFCFMEATVLSLSHECNLLLSFSVKLAIWEVALDNFVESIQPIPEVQWTLNNRQQEIMNNWLTVMVVCVCVWSRTSAPLNANVLIYFVSSDIEVWQKSYVVLGRGYEEDRRAFHVEVNSVLSK